MGPTILKKNHYFKLLKHSRFWFCLPVSLFSGQFWHQVNVGGGDWRSCCLLRCISTRCLHLSCFSRAAEISLCLYFTAPGVNVAMPVEKGACVKEINNTSFLVEHMCALTCKDMPTMHFAITHTFTFAYYPPTHTHTTRKNGNQAESVIATQT